MVPKTTSLKCNSCDAPITVPSRYLSVIESIGVAVFIGPFTEYITCEYCGVTNDLAPGGQYDTHTNVIQSATVVGDGNTVVQSVSADSTSTIKGVSQTAIISGSGAVAQGPGATAVAPGAINMPNAIIKGNVITSND